MQDLEHRGETEAVFQLLLLFVTGNNCHGDIEIFDNIIPCLVARFVLVQKVATIRVLPGRTQKVVWLWS